MMNPREIYTNSVIQVYWVSKSRTVPCMLTLVT